MSPPSHATQDLHRAGADFERVQVLVLRNDVCCARADLNADEVSIGSDPGNDLVIDDPTVSRFHCSLRRIDDSVRVRDLGSRNGTRINEVEVREALVPLTATIEVGHALIELRPTRGVGPSQPADLSPGAHFGAVLGKSARMRRVFRILERAAQGDATVLLQGETGTGKTALARALHDASGRRDRPFVVLDCAALPPNLIESELFGHEKGSFTGAIGRREGAFLAANGGTLFLDEIGELQSDLQPKLLRALEERVVRRVGGTDDHRVDVRLVAATNRDLREEVNNGRFRSDLFYRLDVIRVEVPPLRERVEDIPLLAERFISAFGGGDRALLAAAEIAALMQASWPGNVRELRSTIERALTLGDRASLLRLPNAAAPATATAIEEVPANADVISERFSEAKKRVVTTFEHSYLTDVIASADGNISRAAKLAGMNRNHLRTLLHRHGIVTHGD